MHPVARSPGCWLALTAVVALLASLTPAADPVPKPADGFEAGFVDKAPKLLEHCRDRKFRHVGVLPFQVLKDKKDFEGSINRSLAQRLELSLITAIQDDRDDPKVVILRDAAEDAVRLLGTATADEKGRQQLFEVKKGVKREAFAPAWNWQIPEAPVAADALIQGSVDLSEDLREAKVRLTVHPREGGKPHTVEFDVKTDSLTLLETRESFVLRGALNAKREAQFHEEVFKVVAAERKAAKKDPKLLPEAFGQKQPVELEVWYNKDLVGRIGSSNATTIRSPKPNETVVLRAVRTDKKDEKNKDVYGVVVMVNGLNTLDRQRGDPLACRKWILTKPESSVNVRGYYDTATKDVEYFRVAGEAESSARAAEFGAHAGQITFVVFRANNAPKAEPIPVTEEDKHSRVQLLRGKNHPPRPPATVQELQYYLHKEATTRGLILSGPKEKADLEEVEFKNPGYVMAATITYYNKQK